MGDRVFPRSLISLNTCLLPPQLFPIYSSLSSPNPSTHPKPAMVGKELMSFINVDVTNHPMVTTTPTDSPKSSNPAKPAPRGVEATKRTFLAETPATMRKGTARGSRPRSADPLVRPNQWRARSASRSATCNLSPGGTQAEDAQG